MNARRIAIQVVDALSLLAEVESIDVDEIADFIAQAQEENND